MSVPQMPQASTASTTSFGPGVGSSTLSTLSSFSDSMTTSFMPALFDSTQGEAADELLLSDPSREQHRQARQRRRRGELGVEEAAAADEPDQEDGRCRR